MSRNQYKFYHRINSANTQSSKKQRPRSGPNFNDINNSDISQSFRGKWEDNNFKINRNIKTPLLTNQQMGRKKRISSKITNKSVEQLFEDNMQLKKQNNKLIQQLAQVKGRFQAKSKKGTQKAKQFDLQFQKQLYWGGSKTYLISGIKYQYQKLKQKFDQQKKQYQRLKRAFLQAKIPEYQIHAQNIENQNKRLAEKLKKIIQAANNIPQSSRKVSQVIISQHQQTIKKWIQKNNQLNNELEFVKQTLRQKQKKIIFLQKLLIEKDNKDYNQSKKFRKLQKTVKQLTQTNTTMNEQINRIKALEQEKRKQLMKKHKERKQQLREQFTKEILELRNKIQYLIEDKRQLQNNLSKLKTTMAAGPQRSGVQRRNSICNNQIGSFLKSQTNSPSGINNGYTTSMTLIHQVLIPEGSSFHGYESDQESNQEEVQKKLRPRVMQTADKRHSEQAVKQRKVDYSEISQIGQLIKLRLMSVRMNLQNMKKLFDYKKQEQKQDASTQKLQNELSVPIWQEAHLNMKQVKSILSSAPFNLNEGLAHMLARYMIEDCNEEYVYSDDNNQNKREIVKSIMKTLLGDYSLPTEKQQAEIADFKVKYLSNFYSALKTYYPNGKVSKKKFMQVLTSMGTDLSEKSAQTILAKIVAKSQNLSQLEYYQLQNI